MHEFAPHLALAAIWDLVGAANKYVVEVQPWELAKRRSDDPDAAARLATALYNLAETLRLIAYYCVPFLPTTAETIVEQLGLSLNLDDDWSQVSQWGGYPPGAAIQPGTVLFPKLELPAIDKRPGHSV
jgi:methionyl-tRNA synthetase